MAIKWHTVEDGGYVFVSRDDGSCKRCFYTSDYGSFSEAERAAEDYYIKLQAMDEQKKIAQIKEAEFRKEQEERENQKIRPTTDVPPRPATKKCAKCGADLLDNSLFCHNCGAKREKCCGEFLDAGMKFCPKCGKPTPEEEKRLAEEKRRQEYAKRAEEIRVAEEKRREKEEIDKRLAEEKWRKKAEVAKQIFYFVLMAIIIGGILFAIAVSNNYMDIRSYLPN